MRFDIFNRETIEKYDAKEKHIVISIHDPNTTHAILSETCKDTRLETLFLVASDTDGKYGVPFTREMANKVWLLVDKYKDDIDLIVINCEAGISRSAGVGAALSKVLNNDDTDFFRYFRPNMFIYRKVLSIKQ